MGTRDLEVIEELAPLQGERTVYNWPFGIFQKDRREENDLQQHLDELGVETIVLTGVATGMSVGHAAFTLADRFYNLIVPSDTCTDGNKQLHDIIITSMIPAIALVTTADDVISHLVVGQSDKDPRTGSRAQLQRKGKGRTWQTKART